MSGHPACPDLEVRLENSNVDIVLILIGESQNKIDSWKGNVTCLDIGSNYVDIYEVSEFTDAAFRTIEQRIRDKTCNGTLPVCKRISIRFSSGHPGRELDFCNVEQMLTLLVEMLSF